MIDDVGIIARGSGNTKKEAKSSSGDKALNYLITTDPKSRLILGELLERQVKITQQNQSSGLEANINMQKPNLLQQNNMMQNNYSGQSKFFNIKSIEPNLMNQEQMLSRAQDPNYSHTGLGINEDSNEELPESFTSQTFQGEFCSKTRVETQAKVETPPMPSSWNESL